MKREGRHHNLVMTIHPAGRFQPPRPGLVIDPSDSPPTTAFRTRMPAKPTNHSKYTGRSPGHHRHHQPSKSRDKSKGARKLRDLDVGLNPRLASWRVVAGFGGAAGEGWRLAGGSASAAAVYLSGYPLEGDEEGALSAYLYDEQKWVADNLEKEEEEHVEDVGGGEMKPMEEEEAEEEQGGDVKQERLEEDGGGDEDDDNDTDFCEVWAVWDYVDEEDWCVVGGMEI